MPNLEAENVAQEFFDMLNDLAGNHAIALCGVAQTLDTLEARAESIEEITQESMNLVGYGDPNRIHSVPPVRNPAYCPRLLAGQSLLLVNGYGRYAGAQFTRRTKCLGVGRK